MPRTLLSIAAVLQKSPDIRIESRSGFHSLVKASSEVEEVALREGLCVCVFFASYFLPFFAHVCHQLQVEEAEEGRKTPQDTRNTLIHGRHLASRTTNVRVQSYVMRALYQGCAGYLSRILHVRWCGVRKTTKKHTQTFPTL